MGWSNAEVAVTSVDVPEVPIQIPMSKEDVTALKAAKVETKGDSTVKMPTAEAIAALRKRRAASLKPSVIASAKPVDVCAKARELTMKAKAAANLNKAAPQPRTKVAEVNTLSSFLRNSTKNKAVVDEATSTRIAEAEQLRQMRARAAKADRNSGVTVNVPSALALHQLKQRRDKAASTKNENVGSEDAARRLLAGTLVGRSKIQRSVDEAPTRTHMQQIRRMNVDKVQALKVRRGGQPSASTSMKRVAINDLRQKITKRVRLG